MWLRSALLAEGGSKAQREALLMTTEKLDAATRTYFSLLRGASAETVLADYRRDVRRNGKRLASYKTQPKSRAGRSP
jgi:hypothetical protein